MSHRFVKGRSRQANLASQAWRRRGAAPCSKGFVVGKWGWRGEGGEGLCEAGREMSSAGMVLRGHRGCHQLVESLGMCHRLSCLQHPLAFPELEGHRLPSWAGRHLRAEGRHVRFSERWKSKGLLRGSKDLSLELRSLLAEKQRRGGAEGEQVTSR